jgi:2-dehydropantoate 2-reductase
MKRRIAVLGTGAIGSSITADLTKAGHDVILIDQWPAHVEAVRAGGLRVVMSDEDLRIPVRAHHLCDLASLNPQIDIVLMAVKSYDSRWMAELIKPYLAPDGIFVGVQNSLNDESHASIIGPGRLVGCALELSAEIFTPGLVQRNTTRQSTWFAFGEIDGSATPRLRELETLFRSVGKVELTGNILGTKWTKLVVNSMTMGPWGLLGLKNWQAAELPGMSEVAVKLGRESAAVGIARGYRLEPVFGMMADEFAEASDELLVKTMKTLLGHVGKNSRTAVIQDHLKGRRSEMEHINGLVVKVGREVGVPTPANDALLDLARKINARELRMDVSNLDLLKARIGM